MHWRRLNPTLLRLYLPFSLVASPLALDLALPLSAGAQHELYPIYQDGLHGCMDHSGNVAIECRFDYAFPFSAGLALVRQGGGWGFIDTTGRAVIAPQFVRARASPKPVPR